MVTTKLEVLVEFGQQNKDLVIKEAIRKLHSQNGVENVEYKNGAFMIETTRPSSEILDLVSKNTGSRCVLQGFGDKESAVSMISDKPGLIQGIVRYQQGKDNLVIDGTVDGLEPGDYDLNLHENGDLSEGCNSIGQVYNTSKFQINTKKCKLGELGTIKANEEGRANFRIIDQDLRVSEIIGRSVAISEMSSKPKDSWTRIACGIIARSAGIFQNPKRICACDGVVVWDERERPLAGKGRRNNGENDDCKNNKVKSEGGEKRCCCNNKL